MTEFMSIDGLRIAYTSAGSSANPPVILVHGLTSYRGVWNRTIEMLKDRYYCIAPDLIGFGESAKPDDGDYSIAKQAERMLKIADHFGFEKFTLIGHSMGGQIVTYLASSLAPQRVRKLVSVDGVVTGGLSHRTQTLNRSLIVIGNKIPDYYSLARLLFNSSKPFACWAFRVWFYQPEALPFDSWKVDRDMAANPEIRASAFRAWNSLNATDLTPCIADITSPTLILFGKQDGTVPVEQAHLFKEKLPGAQLVVIDKCGHFHMFEKFEEYRIALEGFLNAS